MQNGLLGGVRVLDLSEEIPGAYATKLMAYMGAEVIKIEPPRIGDASRRASPFLNDIPNPETSGSFLYLNGGKKSITLDISTTTGAGILKELVKDTQILVESFHPETMENLGLGYDVLETLNPSLVLTSVTHFGQTGPYSQYKGGELVDFAVGGNLNLMGLPDREPIKFGGNSAQYMGSAACLGGALVAFYSAERTGVGQHVDMSLQETVICCHVSDLCTYEYTGSVQTRGYGSMVYPCKDGFVGISLHQHLWPRLCTLIGMPELEHDPRFSSFNQRRDNGEVLDAIIIGWMIDKTKDEIYHGAQALNLPSGYVATVEDIIKSPQHESREFIASIDHPETGPLQYPGAPFKVPGYPAEHKRAPLLGEHNIEILCGQLGYTKSDVVMLRGAGII